MPKVSIMIPTYNYARFLREAIQSVLDQTFTDFEIIVVDDGSTDNTKEIVNAFKDNRIRYIFQDHQGVAAADNTAIRAASGEYITGIGADDLYLPQNLELKVKLLDSRPDIGLVCSDAYVFDDKTGGIIGKLWRDPNGSHPRFDLTKAVQQPLKELLHRGCYLLVQTSLIRRQVFDTVGYFDESLSTYEDWELFVRIVQQFAIEIIDMPLVKLRQHSNNTTGNRDRMYLGAVASAKKVVRNNSLSKEELKFLNERILSHHIEYGRQALFNGREPAARKALIAAIKISPGNKRLYVYLLYSILGTRNFLALKKMRRMLSRRPSQRQPPRNTQVLGSQEIENTDDVRPQVSVVLATYNYGRYLGQAIQSILDQTFKDFEIIVSDDGSTDNTREVVEKFNDPRIRYLYQEHIGVSAAENAGLRAARGKYITGLGADDLYLRQNLEIKVRQLDSHPDMGMVYSDCYFFDNKTGAITGNLWRTAKGPHPWFDPVRATRQPLKELLYRGCFIMPQASMMRRQVFNTVGYFDESLPTYEDWDLIIRILQNYSVALIDMPLVKLRQHETNLTGNQNKMYEGAVAAANKVLNSGTLSKEEAKLLIKRLVPQHITYARRALHNGKETASRKALAAAIKFTPWNIKLYGNYLISYLGTRKINALRNLRSRVSAAKKQSESPN